MELGFENIDELIAKAVTGEASREELQQLEQWENKSAGNAAYVASGKQIFETINTAKNELPFNTNAAWNQLNSRISDNGTKIIPIRKRFSPLRVAASVLLIVSLGFLAKWMLTENSVQPMVLSAGTKALQQKLPDGSSVFINKNSEISYALNKDNVREVKLKGEAFFEIVHNEAQPFVITVNGVIIKDIGTAFNVKAISGSNIVEVLVESGEVQFYTAGKTGLNLVKGEKAVYDESSGVFTKAIATEQENTMSYKTKVFHFIEASLKDIIAQINNVYGSDIRLSDEALGKCRLSVAFNNKNIDVVIAVIAETLDLETESSGKTITLKGKGCSK